MKITDLKCAIIGGQPTIRISTDAGIDGYGAAERAKHYIKPHVAFYREYILGEDPRDVARVVGRIRKLGAFKPWGSAVSAIEVALLDIAGQAYGIPIHRLLGGKVRDRVRMYRTGSYDRRATEPEHFADNVRQALADPAGWTMIKQGIGFHSSMPVDVDGFYFGDPRTGPPHPNGGLLTQHGLDHMVACVKSMREAAGDKLAIALDCGPGWTVPDAIRFGKAIEPYDIVWMEDLITGDYAPHTSPAEFREVTRATSTPTHTGEQVYLRNNFRELIETHAVRVIGPDPLDVGGLTEIKWIAEYADMHGVLMAPHGIGNGLLGFAAIVQTAATMPDNYVASECPSAAAATDWWADIVDWMPDPVVRDGHVEVWDRPGLGVSLVPEKAAKHLRDEDKDFFD
ncbi:MAG: mandelate racemase/muconate lactonizing enzyme family protein [Spirochaetota bacterium]